MDDPFLLEGVEKAPKDTVFEFCNGLAKDIVALQQELIEEGIEPIVHCKYHELNKKTEKYVYYTPKYAERGKAGFQPKWVLKRWLVKEREKEWKKFCLTKK